MIHQLLNFQFQKISKHPTTETFLMSKQTPFDSETAFFVTLFWILSHKKCAE